MYFGGVKRERQGLFRTAVMSSMYLPVHHTEVSGTCITYTNWSVFMKCGTNNIKQHATTVSVLYEKINNTEVADKHILGRSDREVQEAGINKKTLAKTTGHRALVTVEKCISVAPSKKVQTQRAYMKWIGNHRLVRN